MNTFAAHLRTLGFLMMGLGVLIVLGYFIDPISLVWNWLRAMPLPVQIGLGAATIGLAIVVGSLLVERYRDRDYDKSLKDDSPS